ncbi:unnamed protein product [Gongylonema pulchrum]|uniref:BACK domain-containing protein n=1 Tax=Gongylonema pulchrum TaxID=637853 RepID=A0A183EBT6_9BILA|nr:unnamed protein product [Gongylonema pulchrum]
MVLLDVWMKNIDYNCTCCGEDANIDSTRRRKMCDKFQLFRTLAEINVETLKKIVARSDLSPSGELSVFKAVYNWAEAECKRRKMEPTPQNRRLVMGDVFNEIRFPTMTVEELGETASSGVLSDAEIGILFRYVTSTVHTGIDLPFPTHERRILSRSRYVVRRFMNLNKNICKKQRSTIWFIVNREILVTALGIYGLVQNEANAEGSEWETTVDIEKIRITSDTWERLID